MRVEGINRGDLPEVSSSTQKQPAQQIARPRQEVEGAQNRDYAVEDLLSRDVIEKEMEKLQDNLTRLNEFMQTYDRGFNFILHEETGKYFVQVIDRIEDEIIREIPPEDILELSARIQEMFGVILDERI